MKKLIIAILFIVPMVSSFSQYREYVPGRRPLNNIAVNICGDASIVSLYYERLFILNPNLLIAGKLGVGFEEPTIRYLFRYMSPPNNYFITMPHHLTFNLGKKRYFVELGMGGSLAWEGSSRNYCLYPVAGFRLQPMKRNNLNIRCYSVFTLSGNEDIKDHFTPLGLSLGICF